MTIHSAMGQSMVHEPNTTVLSESMQIDHGPARSSPVMTARPARRSQALWRADHPQLRASLDATMDGTMDDTMDAATDSGCARAWMTQ